MGGFACAANTEVANTDGGGIRLDGLPDFETIGEVADSHADGIPDGYREEKDGYDKLYGPHRYSTSG